MPYFVEPVVLPTVTHFDNGALAPQFQQFAVQLQNNLNSFEQRGLRLDQVIEVGGAALLVFKQ